MLSGEFSRGLGATAGIVAAKLVLFSTIRLVTPRLSFAHGCAALPLTLISASTQLFAVADDGTECGDGDCSCVGLSASDGTECATS